MYLRVSKGKQKDYLVIVQGYRDGGKVKQRTLCNLGAIDQINKNDILALGSKLLERFGACALINGSEINEESRSNWGAIEVVGRVWQRYGIGELFDGLLRNRKLEYDLESAIKLMLCSRLCDPVSKLSIYNNQDFYALHPKIDLHGLYRSLDELDRYKDKLSEHLFKKQTLIHSSVRVAYFDVTTLYFESKKADSLRDFGFSKDCKFNEVQIVLSLLTDNQGMPLSYEIFSGNMYEGSTLVTSITKLKEKYAIEKIIVVADRGMYSASNLKTISEMGFEYIVGTRLRNSSKKIKESVFNQEDYKTKVGESEKFKYKVINHEERKGSTENIVIAWSQKRALKDARDRQRLIEKAHEMVQAQKVQDKRGAKKYIKLKTGCAEIDDSKIEADRLWDGYYAISTNSNLGAIEVLEAYHGLWKIEDSFRLLKSHFEARPMFHWTAKRISGHIMLNFIALIFEGYIESRVKGFLGETASVSPNKIRSSIESMQRSILEIGGRKFHSYAKLNQHASAILESLDIPSPQSMQIQ